MNDSTRTLKLLLPVCLAGVLLLAGCTCPCQSKTPAKAAAVKAPAAPAGATATQPVVTSGKIPDSGVLFDGKTLNGWIASDFAGRGAVTVSNGQINIGLGHMTGITLALTNELPRMNYEISLDAMRTEGSDFFCALTFPVGKQDCSFIVGGWGGGTVGLSSINSEDASQNETTQFKNFVNGKWHHIRVRVETGKIQAWIDEERVVNFDIEDKRLSIRFEVEPSLPLGISTWNTAAAYKNIQFKRL
jgi:hypothetical protein